jgi:hypothetical protein
MIDSPRAMSLSLPPTYLDTETINPRLLALDLAVDAAGVPEAHPNPRGERRGAAGPPRTTPPPPPPPPPPPGLAG